MPRVSPSRASFPLGVVVAGLIATNLIAASLSMAETADRQQQIEQWLARLGDRRPAVRTQAKQNLMSINAMELPLLRQSVAAGHLKPAQVEPLEAIVTYVSMRGTMLKDLPAKRQPFLGITMSDTSFEQADEQEQVADAGVYVENVAAGYVASRFLDIGDIILAIGRPAEMHATTNFRDLRSVIAKFAPGDLLTVRLLRGGSLMELKLPLDVAPCRDIDQSSMTPDQLAASIDQVKSEANAYWNAEFRPIVDPEGLAAESMVEGNPG